MNITVKKKKQRNYEVGDLVELEHESGLWIICRNCVNDNFYLLNTNGIDSKGISSSNKDLSDFIKLYLINARNHYSKHDYQMTVEEI